MTSQIATNMSAVRAHNVFEKNNAKMATAMNHATTGLKINSAQEGAANWSISERMRERINSLNQAQQNTQNDTAMLKTAEGAVSNTVELLRASKSLVLQAVDASTNDNDRLAIAKQLTQILGQVQDNATNTRYNGKLLLAGASSTGAGDIGDAAALGSTGTMSTLQFQVGDSAGAVIGGVKLQDMTLNGLGLYSATDGGYAALSGISAASAAGNLLRTDGAGYSTGGSALLKNLETALQKALDAATDIGAYEQRLGYAADNVSTQIENLEASDSTIRDADMAKEIADYMKWSVMSQSSQYMLAQSNQNAFSVLNLLQ